MQTITFEPLRWQDEATRVIITDQNAHPKAFFQVTSPKEVQGMTIGRPVEELPRILAILGPAHHIAAARSLDCLFGAESPEPAENMRHALLQTYTIIDHLRKISFLLFSQTHPFINLRIAKKSERDLHDLQNDVQHTLALAQEAARILGGRSEHPITAVAGGMSRFLKKEELERLEEIAAARLTATKRITGILKETILVPDGPLAALRQVGLACMPYLSMAANKEDSDDTVCLKEDAGNTVAHFATHEIPDAIGIQKESWTRAPFAFLKAKGWQGLQAETTEGLFFVGPLARLNGGQALDTPLAEEERSRLISTLGPLPHLDVKAAYWALMVEMLQAAEHMPEMLAQEKFHGPAIRTIPSGIGTEGFAAVESPQGFIFHRYRVDPIGIVKEVEVLDTKVQNNALFCLLTQKALEVSRQQKESWKETKAAMELSLLPF